MAARSSLPNGASSGIVSSAPTSGVVDRTAGDYQLLRRLGSGAMGEVWLGKHRITGGVSAIKLLRKEVALRERVQRFFVRERRAIARLNHPHIIALHGLGPGYIATAYVDGSDLAHRMQTPIEPSKAVRYALQIASALAHAHAHGVVHRDVKPSNILVDRRGNAFLADFGLASMMDDEDETTNDRAGTPAFMAPEQSRGRVGPAADQYALARTLVEVLSGVPLGSGDPFAQLPPELPRALLDVLARALASTPDERFPAMEAFADALAAIDLGDAAAPMRVAPEQRVRGAFGWCVGASNVRAITHEIRCADYKLSDLERAGLLSPAACAEFREQSPYAEMAWTMYAHEGRLGPIASDGVLARASDLVVILHGLLCTRKDWHDVAVGICRNNAQAVVLVPDLFGCGESRYVEEDLAAPRVTLDGLMDSVLRWLDLLSVRDLSTVIVGHSMAATALLAARDDRLGERVGRVAITPALMAASRGQIRALFKTFRFLVSVPGMRRAMCAIMKMTPDMSRLSTTAQDRLEEEFLRAPRWLMGRLCEQYAGARPAPAEELRRCAVLIGEDDAMAPPEQLIDLLIEHGIPSEFIHLITGNGHYPHADNQTCPETKARNVEDITRCVDAMLATSREGTPLSTLMASTVLGDDQASSPRLVSVNASR